MSIRIDVKLSTITTDEGDRDRRRTITVDGDASILTVSTGRRMVRFDGRPLESEHERTCSGENSPAVNDTVSRRIVTDGGTVTNVHDRGQPSAERIAELEAELAWAERTIESLESDTGELARGLATVRENISALDTRGTKTISAIVSLTDRVEELEGDDVDSTALDRLQEDVESLESRLAETATDTDLEGVEDRVETIEADVETIGDVFERIEDDVNTVETNVDAVETDVESIETDVETVERDVESIETNVEAIETNVEAIETNVETVEHGIESIEDRFETLTNSLEGVEDRLVERPKREYVDAQLDALTSVIDDVDTSVDELETAVEELSVDTASVDAATVETLEADVESLSDDLESLEVDLTDRTQWESSVDDEFADVEHRLESLTDSLEGIEDRLAERPTREYVDAQLDALTSVIDDVDTSAEKLETELQSLAETVSSIRTASDQSAADLEAELESVTAELESVAGDLESVSETALDESDLEAATAELADADRLRDLEEAVPMIVMTVDNLENTVSDRLERLDAHGRQAANDDLDALEQRVQERLDEVYTELSTLGAALETTREIVGAVPELERSIESTDGTVRTVRREFREEARAIHDEFETITARIDAVETQVGDVRDDAVDSNEVDTLAETIDELHTMLETLEREVVTTESMATLEAELGWAHRQIDEIDETILDVEASVEDVEKTVGGVEASLETLEPTVSELRTDVDTQERRLGTVSTDLGALETEVTGDTDVESAIDEVETRLDRVDEKVDSDLETLHQEVAELRERRNVDEGSLLERMVTDNVLGLVTVAFVTSSAIGASMAFVDGQYAFAAILASVPVVTVLGAHVLSRRSGRN